MGNVLRASVISFIFMSKSGSWRATHTPTVIVNGGMDVFRSIGPGSRFNGSKEKKASTWCKPFVWNSDFEKRLMIASTRIHTFFNWRFRYNISVTIPLRGKALVPKTPYLFISNEVNVNAGKSIITNYFDQNRSFVGLGYQFSPSMHANLGPLFIFQQSPEPGHYNHTHAIRLYVYHNIDLRKTRRED